MFAQQLQREIGAVRHPEHVPLLDAERDPQLGDVGRVLGGVVGRQADALSGQSFPAGSCRRVALLPRGRVGSRQPERFTLERSISGQDNAGLACRVSR